MFKTLKSFIFRERDAFPETYDGELNYQSNWVLPPASLICVFSWLSYISIDKILYPDVPGMIYFRTSLIEFSTQEMTKKIEIFYINLKEMSEKLLELSESLNTQMNSLTDTLSG